LAAIAFICTFTNPPSINTGKMPGQIEDISNPDKLGSNLQAHVEFANSTASFKSSG
jgi:hypothetical protein